MRGDFIVQLTSYVINIEFEWVLSYLWTLAPERYQCRPLAKMMAPPKNRSIHPFTNLKLCAKYTVRNAGFAQKL